MMKLEIDCDKMSEAWDYNHCCTCNRFSITLTAKGRKWRCKLNSKPASQKRKFEMIWTINYIHASGHDCFKDLEIFINYVGKPKQNDNE
jgi:hypothetical protein